MEDLSFLINKAYFFLKFRIRSEKEIRDYLYKKIINTHYSRQDVEKVIEKLKEQELINDEKFVEIYVKDRLVVRPKSIRLLKRELIKKGINENLIEKYFLENEFNEEETAILLLKKKWGRFKKLNEKKRFEKSIKFLLSRGFSYELAKKAFEELDKKSNLKI